MNPMTAQERDQLLDALIDGTIEEADRLRIEAEMIVDPDVRQHYYRRLQLDLLLEREIGPPQATSPEAFSGAQSAAWAKGRRAMLTGILIGLAASMLLVMLANPWRQQTESDPALSEVAPRGAEPSASGFAVLRGQSEAVWSGTNLTTGDLLTGGALHLRSGTAHIELFSGVQMVIEGDAEFSIDHPMQVTMHVGKARVRVPEPAQGFVLKTASGEVIDLGTEFAVDVSSDDADVRVLEGEVELRGLDQSTRRVRDGQGVRIRRRGSTEPSTGSPIQIASPADFESRMESRQQERLARWNAASFKYRSDPRSVAFYRFSDSDLKRRTLENLSGSQLSPASDGAVVAAEVSTDRWGRSGHALDFSRLGSRIRVGVPGEHRGLTLNCWVRINSLDRWYNSLFLTDGHEDREPHWQIMDDGRIFFSVKVPAKPTKNAPTEQHVFYSPPIWNNALAGRWIMLSVTYDVDGKTVSHYVNGVAVSNEPIPGFALVDTIRIGDASICNWNDPMYRTDAEFVVRNLNGSMDEFSIFSGALSADELFTMYQSGTPHEP